MSFLEGRYEPPKWLLFVRIAQAAVSAAVLGLTAYAFSQFTLGDTITSSAVSDAAPGLPFSFFTFAWTILYLVFAIFFAGLLQAPVKPNMIVIVFECLTVIFWLVTFALLADESANSVLGYSLGYNDYWGVYVSNSISTPAVCVEAAAGLGALVFLLFVASLVVASLSAYRGNSGARFAVSENASAIAAAKEAQQSNHSFIYSQHTATPTPPQHSNASFVNSQRAATPTPPQHSNASFVYSQRAATPTPPQQSNHSFVYGQHTATPPQRESTYTAYPTDAPPRESTYTAYPTNEPPRESTYTAYGPVYPPTDGAYTAFGSNPFSPDDVVVPQPFHQPEQTPAIQQVPVTQLTSPISPQTYRSAPVIYAA